MNKVPLLDLTKGFVCNFPQCVTVISQKRLWSIFKQSKDNFPIQMAGSSSGSAHMEWQALFNENIAESTGGWRCQVCHKLVQEAHRFCCNLWRWLSYFFGGHTLEKALLECHLKKNTHFPPKQWQNVACPIPIMAHIPWAACMFGVPSDAKLCRVNGGSNDSGAGPHEECQCSW
jgi:hypothetical protein